MIFFYDLHMLYIIATFCKNDVFWGFFEGIESTLSANVIRLSISSCHITTTRSFNEGIGNFTTLANVVCLVLPDNPRTYVILVKNDIHI